MAPPARRHSIAFCCDARKNARLACRSEPPSDRRNRARADADRTVGRRQVRRHQCFDAPALGEHPAHRRRASRARATRADRRLGAVGDHGQAQDHRRIAARRRALRGRARGNRRAARSDAARARIIVSRRARRLACRPRSIDRRSAPPHERSRVAGRGVRARRADVVDARRGVSRRSRPGCSSCALARCARVSARRSAAEPECVGSLSFGICCRGAGPGIGQSAGRARRCVRHAGIRRAQRRRRNGRARPRWFGHFGRVFRRAAQSRARRNLDRCARHVQRESAPGSRGAVIGAARLRGSAGNRHHRR